MQKDKIVFSFNGLKRWVGAYWNEVIFVMILVVLLVLLNKGIDFHNSTQGVQEIPKWGLEYITVNFYALLSYGILIIGTKGVFRLVFPTPAEYLEECLKRDLKDKAVINRTDLIRICVSLGLFLLLLFGAILIYNSLATGIA